MSEWKEYSIGEIAEVIGGGTPKTKIKEYWGDEIPWLTPRDLSNFTGRLISRGERNITKLGLDNSSAKLLPKGTILLSSRAPVGYLAIASNEISTNQGFRNLVPNSKVDNIFLYYLLKQNIDYLKSQATGTTFEELSGSTLKSLTFLIPPLPEQRAIAEVLSALDDKIDLLHRQNQTLEALAQTLFRQWFIEEVEDDWEEGVLGDLVEFHYGKGLLQSIRTGSGYPVVGSSGIVDFHSEFLIEGPGIVTGRKGTLGKVIYLFENFFPIDTTFYVKTKKDSPNLYFEYFVLKSIGFENMNTDSAVPGLNRNNALSVGMYIPPQWLITKFNNIVYPLFQKLNTNNSQIRTLENLRDTLLPKLMSGEVRVRGGK